MGVKTLSGDENYGLTLLLLSEEYILNSELDVFKFLVYIESFLVGVTKFVSPP
jgi:hypothetical protein